MVFGFLYLNAQKYGWIDDSTSTSGSHIMSSNRNAALVILAAVLGFGSYTTFTFNCGNKTECNQWHPYIVFIPVLNIVNNHSACPI